MLTSRDRLPDPMRQAVEEKGYRVALEKNGAADFFFAKNLATGKKEVAGALYPELTDGGAGHPLSAEERAEDRRITSDVRFPETGTDYSDET